MTSTKKRNANNKVASTNVQAKKEDGFLSLGYSDVGSNKGQERISNALSVNIAMKKELSLFDNLNNEDKDRLTLSDEAHYIDRRGKRLALSVEDIQIIKALSSYIPFYDPDIKASITAINTMDSRGHLHATLKSPVQLPISILQMSKDIIGDTKEASLKKIAERLKRLEEIEQAQTFYVTREEDGKKITEKYSISRPLIRFNEKIYKHYSEIRSSKGKKKASTPEEKEEKILVGANIIYSSLFLYEATNRYCPMYKKQLFEVWRHNKTEMFAILLSDLESKWTQYYNNLKLTPTEFAKKNKDLKATNKEEYYKQLAEAKRQAMIYKSSTISIRDRVTTDYETDRKQRSRFIPDLQRAIDSLVQYGIITKDSFITKDKSNVMFFYNPNFVPKDTDLPLLTDE